MRNINFKRFIVMLGCTLMLGITVQAQEQTQYIEPSNTAVGETIADNSYDSILQIIVTCTDDDGNVIPVTGGSGFLIGDDDTSLQYVLTAKSAVTVPSDTEYKSQTISVVISNDVTLTASIETYSDNMDFALLKLSKPLSNRHALILNDKDLQEYLRQYITVLGYPSITQEGEEITYYSTADLLANTGILEEEVTLDSSTTGLKHHIVPSLGNIGGPIVDENGTVLAINIPRNDGLNFYAVDIREVMDTLDSFSVTYTTVTQEEERLSAIEQEEMEERSKEEEQARIEQEEIEAKRLAEQQAAAKKKLLLSIAVIVTVITLVTVIVILKLTEKKRKQRKLEKQAQFIVSEPAPDFNQMPKATDASYKALVNAGNGRINETTVLNSNPNSELTTVLSQTHISLIRTRNRENIMIYKTPFVLGKDKAGSDYWVSDNPAVSRIHATILQEDNQYVIRDNNATNGTYVNGQMVQPGMTSPIFAGTIIELGDERFEVCVNA
jgi:hypothetical protein